MSHELRYRSTRAEVWRWYWRTWKARLWRLHVLIAAGAAFICACSFSGPITLLRFLESFCITLPATTASLALWPQLMFKSNERVLTVDAKGWSTRIGRKSGSCPWPLVASIRDSAATVTIVGVNGNALIIPLRAFPDHAAMYRFADDARRWHCSANTG